MYRDSTAGSRKGTRKARGFNASAAAKASAFAWLRQDKPADKLADRKAR